MIARLVLGAAASLALVAAPASAGGWYGGGHGGYSHHHGSNGGDVAAALIGGLLVGGLISAAASKPAQPVQGSYAQPDYVPQNGYAQQNGYAPQGGYAPQPAPAAYAPPAPDAASAQVELCARAAERSAQGTGGFARVIAIDGISGDQGNAEVRGTLEINRDGGATRTGFSCAASYGQVTGMRFG